MRMTPRGRQSSAPRRRAWAAAVAASLLVGFSMTGGPLSDPLPDIAPSPVAVRLETIVGGLVFPTDVAAPPDGSDRLFVTSVHGVVSVVQGGALLPAPFVDLSADYFGTNGSAMSSVAFHPDFATNRTLYVIMTELESPALADFGVLSGVAQQSVLYELKAQADHPAPASNLVEPASKRELLRINEDSTIHNLGELAFGPDGYLYMTKGDDQTGGQDLTTIHGSVLRIDVDRLPGNPLSANGQYAIPTDNPFVGVGGGTVEEIFAYGFRNPWRMSFDQATGQLWVTDVGELDIEEVNHIVAGGNHGWPYKEGAFAALPGGGVSADLSGLPPGPFTDPFASYDHGEQDRSITGGVLYRGWRLSALAGQYVFGDWISGRLFHMHPATGVLQALSPDPAGAGIHGQLSGSPFEGIISVAEDGAGELVLVVTQRNMTPTGRLLRVVEGTVVQPGSRVDATQGLDPGNRGAPASPPGPPPPKQL